ncbi:MAG: septum formation initiator family protein [Chloroflexota bacterium]|nr:septum formation initiator family protein [Chloroflexota bacterium]
MSIVIRARKARNRPASTLALWLGLGIVAVFFLVRYGQELLLEHSLRDQAASQRVANALLEDNNTRLDAQLQYYQSNAYIEQRAREDLNLRMSNEEVLIPVGVAAPTAVAGSTGPAITTPQSVATPVPATENWQKWFDLFAPANSP